MSLMIGAVVIIVIIAGAAFLCIVKWLLRILHKVSQQKKL